MTRSVVASAPGAADERELAEQVCRACVDGLDVDGAAISLLPTAATRTILAATDATARLLEDLQFSLNEGACMEAAASGRPVLVPDLHHDLHTARWPLFAAAVAERTAVGALFALPLQWGAVTLGVLDLYRIAPGQLADDQWSDLSAVADTTTWLFLGRRTMPGPAASAPVPPDGPGPVGHTERWLDETIGYRAEVHQATGMVLAQLGCSPTEALARMRGYAFAHDMLLADVAREVVARRLAFTEETL
ncbi:GAF and ANTAR domain-containing protein [Pseudonocardia tropica]|uniref:GAF and ANTAR domain-containing protein n=1 Tax=Pseudonocardia tropica TaxID=681289 RepID=A0ABV1K0Q4_9PSEU